MKHLLLLHIFNRMKSYIITPLSFLVAGTTAVQAQTFFQNEKSLWGLKDNAGKIIVVPKYDNESEPSFDEGFAAVSINGKWGFVDMTGKEITPIKYERGTEAPYFMDGFTAVKLNGKWGFVNAAGKEISEFVFDNMYRPSFTDGLAFLNKGGKYNEETDLFEGGKWGCIDTAGREIVAFKYDENSLFEEGFAHVNIGGKYGFINTKGEEITPIKYDYISGFNEGMAAINIGAVYDPETGNHEGGKWGFINTKGKEVIPPQYEDLDSFSGGKARVVKNGREYYIDKTGKEIKK